MIVDGTTENVNWPIAGCQDNYFQNGDLDFDGSSWTSTTGPTGRRRHPTSFSYIGPFTHGRSYPKIQSETDIAGSEADCNVATGAGCTARPRGARCFYAFWSLSRSPAGLHVELRRDVIRGRTITDFGGDAQYGTPNVARYGGTLTSPVLANPQTRRWC